MRFNILSDAEWESKIRDGLKAISTSGYQRVFEERDYGTGLRGVIVVLMCRDPKLNFKQRIRFTKKEKKLYMDIMLDLNLMQHSEPAVRKKIVIQRLADEVPAILHKYAFPDFDEPRFVADLKEWLSTSMDLTSQS